MEGLEFLAIPEKMGGIDVISYQYFNQLLNHRTIVLNEEISENLLETVILPLKDFEEDTSEEPVTLIINTDGGQVINGMTIFDIIDNYKKPLNIICHHAFSMGANILCAGRDNPNVKKYCYEYSYILFHNGESGLSGETRTVEDFVSFYKNVDNRIKDYILTHTNIPENLYKTFDRRQIFLNSKEMLLYGIVDEIIGVAKIHSECKDCAYRYDCEMAYELALDNYNCENNTFICEDKDRKI